MIKINLLSEGRRPVVARKAKRPTLSLGGQDPNNLLLVVGFIAGALVVGAWWYLLNSELSGVEAEVRAARAEYEELRPIIQEVNDFKVKQAELEGKVQVIKDLKAQQAGPVHIMDRISRAVPELLWLENMTLRGRGVTLKGRAFNTNAIATFIQNLDRVEEFEEPSAKNIRQQGRSGSTTYQFDISFSFVVPQPEEEEAEALEG